MIQISLPVSWIELLSKWPGEDRGRCVVPPGPIFARYPRLNFMNQNNHSYPPEWVNNHVNDDLLRSDPLMHRFDSYPPMLMPRAPLNYRYQIPPFDSGIDANYSAVEQSARCCERMHPSPWDPALRGHSDPLKRYRVSHPPGTTGCGFSNGLINAELLHQHQKFGQANYHQQRLPAVHLSEPQQLPKQKLTNPWVKHQQQHLPNPRNQQPRGNPPV